MQKARGLLEVECNRERLGGYVEKITVNTEIEKVKILEIG